MQWHATDRLLPQGTLLRLCTCGAYVLQASACPFYFSVEHWPWNILCLPLPRNPLHRRDTEFTALFDKRRLPVEVLLPVFWSCGQRLGMHHCSWPWGARYRKWHLQAVLNVLWCVCGYQKEKNNFAIVKLMKSLHVFFPETQCGAGASFEDGIHWSVV